MFLRIIYLCTFAAWIALMITIMTLQIAYSDKVPLCMFSTMAIFGIASLAIKWYEKRNGKDAL